MKEAQLTNKPKSEISKQVNDNNKKRHRQNCAKLIIWPWPEKLCILYHEGRYIITWVALRKKNFQENFSHQKTFYLAQMNGGLEKKFFENIASKASEKFSNFRK